MASPGLRQRAKGTGHAGAYRCLGKRMRQGIVMARVNLSPSTPNIIISCRVGGASRTEHELSRPYAEVECILCTNFRGVGGDGFLRVSGPPWRIGFLHGAISRCRGVGRRSGDEPSGWCQSLPLSASPDAGRTESWLLRMELEAPDAPRPSTRKTRERTALTSSRTGTARSVSDHNKRSLAPVRPLSIPALGCPNSTDTRPRTPRCGSLTGRRNRSCIPA